MTYYDKAAMDKEMKLMKEISAMKFSVKKLLKAIELDALISHYNK